MVATSMAFEMSPRGSASSTTPIGQTATVRVRMKAPIRNALNRSHNGSSRRGRDGNSIPTRIWIGATTAKNAAANGMSKCWLSASRWRPPSAMNMNATRYRFANVGLARNSR